MSKIEFTCNLGIPADASLDTASVQLRTCTLATLSYPDIIPNAQQKLDSVVRPDQLPAIGDRSKLPHVAAGIKEAR